MNDHQVLKALRALADEGKQDAPAFQLTKAQLHAFLALVASVLIVSLAPVVVTGLMGRTVPDSLIAVSDKTVTGLIGVLGTLVGVMWQTRPRAGDQPPASGKPDDPVHTVEEK